MNNERYKLLMESEELLTADEIALGWHFCNEFDGLLVGPGMDELNYCSCWPKGHSVHETAPSYPEPTYNNEIL